MLLVTSGGITPRYERSRGIASRSAAVVYSIYKQFKREAFMKKRLMAVCVFAFVMPLSASTASAAGQEMDGSQARMQNQEKMRHQEQGQVYGSQMMTEQEQQEYRDRMRAAKTSEEQKQIRNEHHERMQERAREHGIALPEEPPAGSGQMRPGTSMESGGYMGPGKGMGAGGGMMGPGTGMGQGKGMGSGGGRGH